MLDKKKNHMEEIDTAESSPENTKDGEDVLKYAKM